MIMPPTLNGNCEPMVAPQQISTVASTLEICDFMQMVITKGERNANVAGAPAPVPANIMQIKNSTMGNCVGLLRLL